MVKSNLKCIVIINLVEILSVTFKYGYLFVGKIVCSNSFKCNFVVGKYSTLVTLYE